MSELERKTETALITPEFLQTIEPELVQLFQSRILQRINAIESSRWRKMLMVIAYVLILCAIFTGIGLGGYLVFFDQSICRSTLLNIMVLMVFSILLYLFRSFTIFNQRLMPNYQKISLKAANRITRLMLKQAKKIAPFIAEYEYKNDVVSYYRIKDDVVSFAWSRKLPSTKIEGKGFVLYFKKEKDTHPFAIILSPTS